MAGTGQKTGHFGTGVVGGQGDWLPRGARRGMLTCRFASVIMRLRGVTWWHMAFSGARDRLGATVVRNAAAGRVCCHSLQSPNRKLRSVTHLENFSHVGVPRCALATGDAT